MRRKYEIISSDGHVMEPPGMWERHLSKEFHDRAPKLVKDPEGGDAWELMPGAPPMPIGLVTNSGKWGRRYEDNQWYGYTYDSIRKGAFDGKERLVEQDIDGVDAETIFPSQRTMGVFMGQEDDRFHLHDGWVGPHPRARRGARAPKLVRHDVPGRAAQPGRPHAGRAGLPAGGGGRRLAARCPLPQPGSARTGAAPADAGPHGRAGRVRVSPRRRRGPIEWTPLRGPPP